MISWLFLAIYIGPGSGQVCQRPLRVDVCKSLLVSQYWYVHMYKSIRKCCPCGSSWLLQQCPTCLFLLTWRWEMSGHTAAIFKDSAFRISSKQYVAFLCSSLQAFSPSTLLDSWWCIYTIVLTWQQLWRIPVSFYQWSDFHMIDDQPMTIYTFPMHIFVVLSSLFSIHNGLFQEGYNIWLSSTQGLDSKSYTGNIVLLVLL